MQPNSNQKVALMSTTSNESMPANEKSGKRLILGVVAACLVAAIASWWFRYAATHRAAQFWGSQAVALIRDAPHVTLRSDATVDRCRRRRGSRSSPATSRAPRDSPISAMRCWRMPATTGPPATPIPTGPARWSSPQPTVPSRGLSSCFRPISNGSPTARPPTRSKQIVSTTAEFADGLKKFFADDVKAQAEQ